LTSVDVLAKAIDQADGVHFVKTHELATDDVFPAIYVVRDGREALVSLAHFLIDSEIGNIGHDTAVHYWQTLHELITTNERYVGWSQKVQSWLHRPRTALVKFEELVKKPVEVVREALHKLQIDPRTERSPGQSVASFDELHRESPRFFRAGASGTWQKGRG
jgi:hypothetical protein